MDAAHSDSLDARARAGGVTFESVYRGYLTQVSRWAARLGSPWVDPEDITHDLFLKLMNACLKPGQIGGVRNDHGTIRFS